MWRLLLVIICLLGVGKSRSSSSSSDIECLRSIKQSVRDPRRSFSTWEFNNSICSFNGVHCSEGKLRRLNLNSMGLVGEFPRGIAHCTGLTDLVLSNNNLSGSIPPNISRLITLVNVLDLSHCKFSGEIPVDISNCKYLTVLKLNNNLLTGRIPASLASLRRLKSFTVVNNLLEGPVPRFSSAYFPRESYAHNAGLCGDPLKACDESESWKNLFVTGFLPGWSVTFLLFLLFRWFRPLSEFVKRKLAPTSTLHESLPLKQRVESTMISRLEKFVARMSLLELRQATCNFSDNNVIAVAEMGITYKAVLSNGWSLAVKRLSTTPLVEHEFLSEITTLGRLRHRNLVPLLGFCQESNDRFLIYKLMPNGTLHDCLFGGEAKAMEWPVRAKIAVGIAKGIAWLHVNGIVHRGISSKCIMLDEDFNPRISDFGKATTLDHTDSSWELPNSSRELSVLGCYKEDVHSFGKVLLELIMGRKYNEIISSFDMDGDMLEQMFKNAGALFDDEIMCCFFKVAAKCLECDPCSWPRMEEVCQMLIAERRDGSAASSTEIEIKFLDSKNI
ncbi:hypothetical protein C2S52_005796 [Perilla frutescens var. hirtella]|nr:hypothetical protein C2S52_005796 [Perilla frutescens var. hirtella]